MPFQRIALCPELFYSCYLRIYGLSASHRLILPGIGVLFFKKHLGEQPDKVVNEQSLSQEKKDKEQKQEKTARDERCRDCVIKYRTQPFIGSSCQKDQCRQEYKYKQKGPQKLVYHQTEVLDQSQFERI
jgi:hypothetical protein